MHQETKKRPDEIRQSLVLRLAPKLCSVRHND
jgi:hypothetical protein